MKYKTKRTRGKVCTVVDVMGNEVMVKCGKKGTVHCVNSNKLRERARWI